MRNLKKNEEWCLKLTQQSQDSLKSDTSIRERNSEGFEKREVLRLDFGAIMEKW